VKSPLNGEAARWVQEHEDQLPLDRVSMLVDENRLTQQEPATPVAAPQVPAPPPIPEPIDPDQVDDNEFIVDEDQHDDSAQGTEDDDYVDDAFLESPANSAPLKRSTRQPARTTMSEPTIAGDKMKISCPSCEKVSVVPKTAAGRKAQCLQCRTSFRIPSA
jgi:ribosomal protein S27E